MASIREKHAQLYTPIYDELMIRSFAEHEQKHKLLSKEIMDSTKEYKVSGLSTLGRWVSASEGATGGYEDPVLDYAKTYTQEKFWDKIEISFEAADQDEYALLKREGQASGMGIGARDLVEATMAAHLYNGFSVASPDGQYLFSNSHPKNSEETGTTYDNLLSGAFSHDKLEDAEAQIANNFFTLKGIPILPSEDAYIVYPPALAGTVDRVLNDRATERPDTTQRDFNRYAGRYKQCNWIYLCSQLGGSDTAWYIIYPRLGYFKIIWNAKPHFTSWIDEDKEFYIFKGRCLFASGIDNWRVGFASTGL